MNPLVRQYINHKLNHLTVDELIKLGKISQIHFTKDQATKVLNIMSQENIDIENKPQINRLLKQVGKGISKEIESKLRYVLTVIYNK